jgi:hypothetical protein
MHSPWIRLKCGRATPPAALGIFTCFYWLVSVRAFVASSSRLRLRQLFLPLASFFPRLRSFPSSLVVLCCVASSAKRSSSPLDHTLLLLNSQWPLLVIASIPALFHLSYHHLIPPYQLFQELLPTPCFCPVRVANPLCKTDSQSRYVD